MKSFKPKNYNSLSPYLIVDDAQELVNLLKIIFKARELRKFNHTDGKIAHIELKIDDSIIMISNSTEKYFSHTSMLHLYVADVHQTFDLAIRKGCKIIEEPKREKEDSDTRGSFYDTAGNHWAISTQFTS